MDLSSLMLFGRPFFDLDGSLEMLVRFAVNNIVVVIVAIFFYYPKSRRRDYVFTFLMLSVCIFMLIFLMEGSKLKIGAALGLFAIFGILRYRTEAVPIREMTYLFFIVSLSVINGMAVKLSFGELLLADLIFVLAAWRMESTRMVAHVCTKYIKYDKIELIKPDKRQELIADLEERTGLKIIRVEVGSLDLLKDMALIRVYYHDHERNTIENLQKLPKTYE